MKLLVLLIAVFSVQPAHACDSGTVRDAALLSTRGEYRLCVFVRSTDLGAADEVKRLEAGLDAEASRLNIKVERVNVDAAALDWPSYGINEPPAETPVTALVGSGGLSGRSFVLDYWQPYPTDAELAAIKTSPAREAIKEGIASHWAIILYSPGDPTLGPDGSRPDEVFSEVEKEWAIKQSPGVVTVKFDRNSPSERMLRTFTGMDVEGPAWAAIVFGRGKVLAPPLTGSAITRKNLSGLLDQLAVACTCLQDSTVNGLDIPMTWDARLDAVVAALKPTAGYFETTLPAAGAARAGGATDPPPQSPTQQTGHILALALGAGAFAALVAVTATGIVLYRTRRNSP